MTQFDRIAWTAILGSATLVSARQPAPSENPTRSTSQSQAIAAQLAQQNRPKSTDAPEAPDPDKQPEAKFIPAKPLTVAEANAVESQKQYVIGIANIANQRFTDAAIAFRKALEKDPTNLGALNEIVPLLAFQLDRPQEAMKYCRDALKLDPENALFLRIMAQRYMQAGDQLAAIDALEKACGAAENRKKDPAGYLQMKLELAQLYDQKRKPGKAADSLADVIRVAENSGAYQMKEKIRLAHRRNLPRYRENYVRALIAAQRFEEAQKQLEVAIKEESGKRLGILLAEVLFGSGKYEAALAELNKYRKLQMIEERAPVLLEKIYDKIGKSKDYLSTLEQWVRDDRSNPVLRRVYGEKLMAAKRYAEARTQLSQIGNKPETLPLLARLFREMNDPEQLLETLAKSLASVDGMRSEATSEQIDRELKAIANDKELLKKVAAVARDTKKNLGVEPFVLNLLIAMISKSAKDVELAREFYDRCLKERNRPEEYEEVINLLFDAERYKDAEGYCRKAIVRDPDEHLFRDMLVRALGLQDKHDEAIATAQGFVDKIADRDALARAILSLAWAYQSAGKYDQAAQSVVRVIEQFPGHAQIPYARYLLSNIWTQKGDNAKAEEQLKKLVDGDADKVSPKLRATANNDLGYMWADRGHNLEKAEAMIRRALEIEPDNGAYLDSLGWLLFKRSRFAEARTYLAKAVKQHEDGNDPVIWDHLGDVCLQLGDKSEAKKAWETAFELFVKQKKVRDRTGDKARDVRRKIDGLEAKTAGAPQRAGKDDP